MWEKDVAIEKIKKLLSVANAKKVANEHEAENALRIAQRLMILYNISEVQLHSGIAEDLGKDVTGRYLVSQGRATLEDKFINGLIMEFFNVRLIWRGKGNLYAVGTETNLDIAENVYWYLRGCFRELWLKYYYAQEPLLRTTADKQPYFNGLRAGLRNKLEEERKQVIAEEKDACTALIVVGQALDRRYREMFPGAKNVSYSGHRPNAHAFDYGKSDGGGINIRKGIVSGGSRSQKKLGGSKGRTVTL